VSWVSHVEETYSILGERTACAKSWRELLYCWRTDGSMRGERWSWGSHFLFLPPVPLRVLPHLLTLLFFFAQLWFAGGIGCLRESHFPLVTYLQKCWCRSPMENLEPCSIYRHFCLTQQIQRVGFVSLPFKGHLYGIKWFPHLAPGQVFHDWSFVQQGAGSHYDMPPAGLVRT
jgi:hypothetical protein